ncbi:MAG TPA: outer membrane lipoprotein chaperone LolA [Gammaproteobacteria bacterium]|nr:outer membrane lipoprotein chaperone LolA [Gammaproteobacteria bacterium]
MLRTIRLLAKTMAVVAISSTVQAQTDLQSRLAGITSMQAKFNQNVYSENNKLLHTYSGQMEFKKPNSFRWEVLQPDPSLLVTDGKKLWNYDADLEQVTVQKYNANKELTPLSFVLEDPAKLNQNFSIEAKARDCYKLTPKEENSNFVNVEVCFKDLAISSVNILDHLGQNSAFEFMQVVNNRNIADQRFSFKPPAGVDVVGE